MINRTIIVANKVLPPFALISYPESIDVTMEASGDSVYINVPIKTFSNTDEYLSYLRGEIEAVQNSVVMATAEKVIEVNVGDEEPIDEFGSYMSMKTLDTTDWGNK